ANWMACVHGVEVILASTKGCMDGYFVSPAVTFYEYKINESNKIFVHWKMYHEVQKTIQLYHPDVFLSFWVHPLFFASLSPSNHHLTLIYSGRNDPKSIIYSKICRIIRWFVVRRADGIVFQTREAMDFFDESVQRKSVVIHNAVSQPPKDCIISKRDERIVSVGRLVPEKNHTMLIRAFNEIKSLFPEASLEIYGEGPLHEQLQSMIEAMNLSARVRLMGEVSDIRRKICGARLFVLPSLFEGMPNALMEAMSLGLTVLASDCPCGGPSELIQNGVNGFLFTNGNQRELEQYMKHILKCKDNCAIREEARKICETHSEDRIYRKWLNYIYMAGKSHENLFTQKR
ncbi:MAG: glycosyltransferase, partial [Schwartzia sp.]|nr:glycosyltransferase [Schwartzia sp. (in: firmicutes)]